MKIITPLAAIAVLSLGMAVPSFAQDLTEDCVDGSDEDGCAAVPAFDAVTTTALTTGQQVGIAIGILATVGLLAASTSGSTSGTN